MNQDEKFVVMVDGKAVTYLNSGLATRQHSSDEDIERPKKLHALKYHIIQLAHRTVAAADAPQRLDKYMLRMLAKQDREIEFELQRSWHFAMDDKFHRPWNFPGCSCPKMDNEDSYPTGFSYVNQCCPVHGQQD